MSKETGGVEMPLKTIEGLPGVDCPSCGDGPKRYHITDESDPRNVKVVVDCADCILHDVKEEERTRIVEVS
jgi:hypothetical protein